MSDYNYDRYRTEAHRVNDGLNDGPDDTPNDGPEPLPATFIVKIYLLLSALSVR